MCSAALPQQKHGTAHGERNAGSVVSGSARDRISEPRRPRDSPVQRKEIKMDRARTWLAITGVVSAFTVLGWLLFSENPSDKNKNKP